MTPLEELFEEYEKDAALISTQLRARLREAYELGYAEGAKEMQALAHEAFARAVRQERVAAEPLSGTNAAVMRVAKSVREVFLPSALYRRLKGGG